MNNDTKLEIDTPEAAVTLPRKPEVELETSKKIEKRKPELSNQPSAQAAIDQARSQFATNRKMDGKLSNTLEQHRRKLEQNTVTRRGISPEKIASLRKSLRAIEEEHAKSGNAANQKASDALRAKRSFKFDPLGVIANLLKKLERMITGAPDPNNMEPENTPLKDKIVVKKKKSKLQGSKKKKTGFYNLDKEVDEELETSQS